MRVLVTGSSGFIGSHLVRALSDRGHHVVGLDRELPDWSRPHEFVQADLLEEDAVRAAMQEVDCVFHLAASKDDWGISRDEYFRDNVEATRTLIEVGEEAGPDRWLYYSTVGVLPRGSKPLDEDAPFDPETHYGASKAEAEKLFREFHRRRPETSVTILRPSAVFGPRNPPKTNVHRLIEAIRSGSFVMVGSGRTRKTTSYIENLIGATLFLFDRSETGIRVLHYVDEPVMTTEYLVDAIYRALGKERPSLRIPLSVARPLAHVSDLAASILGVDLPITGARIEKFCTPTNFSSDAIRDLGFRQPIPNEEALAKTVDWHLQRIDS